NRVVRDDVVTGDQIQPVTRRHGDAAGDVTTHQINGHYGPAGLKLPRPLRFGTLAPSTERVDTARQEDLERPAVLSVRPIAPAPRGIAAKSGDQLPNTVQKHL